MYAVFLFLLADAKKKDNNVHDNADAGIAMLESFYADVSGNTLRDNKYGIRLSVASAHNVFSRNEISGSSQ